VNLARILKSKPKTAADHEDAIEAVEASIRELEQRREALVERRRSALFEIAETELELSRLREGLIELRARHKKSATAEFAVILEQRAKQARADAEELLQREIGELIWHLSDVRMRMDAINAATQKAKRPDLRVHDRWREITHAAPSSWNGLPVTAFVSVPNVFPLNVQAGRRRENLVTVYDKLLAAFDEVAPKTKRQSKRA
jgi:hypothetical protein